MKLLKTMAVIANKHTYYQTVKFLYIQYSLIQLVIKVSLYYTETNINANYAALVISPMGPSVEPMKKHHP